MKNNSEYVDYAKKGYSDMKITMKCNCGEDIKNCCNQNACCDECGYEDCHEGCTIWEQFENCDLCKYSENEVEQ